jgi:hypothetical protein
MGPADDLTEALFGLLELPFGLFEQFPTPSFWLVFWTEIYRSDPWPAGMIRRSLVVVVT